MVPVEIFVIVILAIAVVFAVVATTRVIKERDNIGRTVAQLAFVWLMPFLGPIITIQLLSREAERGSGAYPPDNSLLDNGGHINLRDAKFSSSSNEQLGHGETSETGHE